MKIFGKRSRWIIATCLVLAAGGVVWFAKSSLASSATPTYETSAARRGDLEVTISAAGTLAPKETVEVGAQVSGQLEELFVDVGDEVEEGQLLAQIDATIAQNTVEAQQAQLNSLYASKRQQAASLKLAKAEAARANMLFEADAIARADYEAMVSELEIAEGKLDAINAQIAQQISSLRADEANLEFTKIYAPISGTVVSLSAAEGQTLNANQTAPIIMTIADLGIMTVEADVSEADVLRVSKGQQAWFTTLGDSDHKWETQVRQVLPTPEVVNDVVLYKALLDVENPDGILRSDMTAQVFFIQGQTEDAILIPVTALQSRPERPEGTQDQRRERPEGDTSQGERPANGRGQAIREARALYPDAEMGMVLKLDANGEALPQPVLIGLQTRTSAEILFGLSEGDEVVTGQVTIRPKQSTERRDTGQRRPMGPPPV
jgi:membrane fusion protein, macrolide-specific efflux system